MTSAPDGQAITVHSIVVAAPDQVSSDVAGETILLSLASGMYYGLTEVGARLFELTRVPSRVADLCDVIAREYDVDPERCERDVVALLVHLAEAGLIEVTDGRGRH